MIWFLGRLESLVISHHQESSNPATGSRSLAIDVGKGREGSDGKMQSIMRITDCVGQWTGYALTMDRLCSVILAALSPAGVDV